MCDLVRVVGVAEQQEVHARVDGASEQDGRRRLEDTAAGGEGVIGEYLFSRASDALLPGFCGEGRVPFEARTLREKMFALRIARMSNM